MNRNKFHKSLLCLITALAVILGGNIVFAENIDPGNDGSRYAYGENTGWLNAEPQGNGGPGIVVGDSALTGYIWAENIGWINLSCSNTGTCGTVSYGVANNGSGALSGYAWGENVGWINFSPTRGGVTVDSNTGDFSGRAWGENIGWITFSSTSPVAYKVRTAWSVSAPPSDGGSSPSGNGGGNNNNGGGDSGGDQPATGDTEPPVNKNINFINNGKPSANGRSVTLNLLASDNVAVTAYFVSESSSKPGSNQKGWRPFVTPAKNLQTRVYFNLGKTPGTKTVHVWFKDARGNVSDAGSDDITLPKKALKSPVITSLRPKTGPSGITVAIRGENFANNNSKKKNVVRFNGKKGRVISVNKKGTLIKAVVPSGAGTGPITIKADKGTAGSEDNFTVITSGGDVPTGGGPKIKRFRPKSGEEGTTVTIFGKKFSPIKAKNTVKFGNAKAVVKFVNRKGTKLKVKVPKKAKTGYIKVKVVKNTAKSKTKFLVK